MKVLVCGGVRRKNPLIIARIMDEVHRLYGITEVIHGDSTGAPRLVHEWCIRRGIKVTPYRVQWKVHGNMIAGPVRNRLMLREHPDLLFVLAFSRCKRVAHLLESARAEGIPIRWAREFDSQLTFEDDFPDPIEVEPGLTLRERLERKLKRA